MSVIFPPVITGGRVPSVIYNSGIARTASTNVTSFTLSNCPLGPEDPSRLIVVGTYCFNSSPLPSVTIGGNAATEIAAATHTFGFGNVYRVALWQRSVPTGATANIVLNAGGFAYFIVCWSVYGLRSQTVGSSASNVATNTANPSVTLNVQNKAIVIGMAGVGVPSANGALNGVTWTGLTENFDVVGSSNLTRASGASGTMSSDSAAYSVSINGFNNSGTAESKILLAATWR